jgi:hypothetical protein
MLRCSFAYRDLRTARCSCSQCNDAAAQPTPRRCRLAVSCCGVTDAAPAMLYRSSRCRRRCAAGCRLSRRWWHEVTTDESARVVHLRPQRREISRHTCAHEVLMTKQLNCGRSSAVETAGPRPSWARARPPPASVSVSTWCTVRGCVRPGRDAACGIGVGPRASRVLRIAWRGLLALRRRARVRHTRPCSAARHRTRGPARARVGALRRCAHLAVEQPAHSTLVPRAASDAARSPAARRRPWSRPACRCRARTRLARERCVRSTTLRQPVFRTHLSARLTRRSPPPQARWRPPAPRARTR